MPTAKVNGTEIYYESHGEGPAIVFAHGRGGNHMSWWQQAPVFAKDYRCITFDHRGWGASLETPNGPGRSAFVEDLKQLLDHLEVDQAFLVAQSMGGLTCLGFALVYPERVIGLVLGDTTGGVGDASVLDVLSKIQAPAQGINRTLSGGFIAENPGLTFLYQQIQGLNPPNSNDGIIDSFRDPNGPSANDLAGLQAPTLLIVGQEDLIFPPQVVEAVHKLIPGSKLEVVPQAAHSTHFEQPQVFNKLIGEFFQQVLAGRTATAVG